MQLNHILHAETSGQASDLCNSDTCQALAQITPVYCLAGIISICAYKDLDFVMDSISGRPHKPGDSLKMHMTFMLRRED